MPKAMRNYVWKSFQEPARSEERRLECPVCCLFFKQSAQASPLVKMCDLDSGQKIRWMELGHKRHIYDFLVLAGDWWVLLGFCWIYFHSSLSSLGTASRGSGLASNFSVALPLGLLFCHL